MRPRFSLRWLLIAFVVVAFVSYVFFIRPTVIARSFVTEIENRDFSQADRLFRSSDFSPVIFQDGFTSIKSVHVFLTPQEWGDVWRGQRRISIYADFRHQREFSSYSEWRRTFDSVVGPIGLSIVRETDSSIGQIQ